jgi:hypothetical protein
MKPFTIEDYTGVGGAATNASYVGPWILIEDISDVGFQAVLTGTSNPTATWGADVTNQVANPNVSAPPAGKITALTLTDEMTDQNPAGDGANINYLFQFSPAPRAKWMRFKYTRSLGGSASLLLQLSVQGRADG